MVKNYLIAGLLSVFCVGFAQQKEDNSIAKQRKDLLEKIANHPFKKDLESPKKLPNGKLPPDLYFKQDYLRTMNPETGMVDPFQLSEVRKEVLAGKYSVKETGSLTNRMPGSAEEPWVSRGPYDVGGRTRAIMFDPNDATGKRVFAGGVSGGLWVNDDITSADSEWEPVDDFWANTSISCIVYDPNDTQTFYVGTGEVYTGDIRGLGIFKTTDGGTTWQQIFNDTGYYTGYDDLAYGNFYITDIKVRNNSGTSELFVGVAGAYADGYFNGLYRAGLYKSTDGGNNFERLSDLVVEGTSVYKNINKIEIGADNSIWVGTMNDRFNGTISGGQIFKSTDGSNFSKVYEYSTEAEVGRVELALSSSDANKAYSLMQTGETDTPVKILKTTDGGTTWTEMTLPEDVDTGIDANDFTRDQSFYDLEIVTDPENDEIVYVGGIDLFRTTDGATSWTQISKWSNNNQMASLEVSTVHADQHKIVFNPQNTSQMLFGNDGGIYYAADKSSLDATSAIEARNTAYNVTQFYDAAINPTASTANEEIVAGAQDNGTQALTGAPNADGFYSGFMYTGGDGALVAYDDEADYLINGYIRSYHYLNNGTFMYLLPSDERGNGDFINEMALDKNQDVVFTKREDMSFNVTSGLKTATATSELTTTVYDMEVAGKSISHLSVSPYNTTSTDLYVGTTDGALYKVSNANLGTASNAEIASSIVGSISDISFGLSANELLVTASNYNVNNIWYSADGGTTWEEKDGNLPDMPVRAIFMNPYSNNQVIVGTELGVWSTSNFQDDSPTWATSNNGLANVKVTDFDYRASDETVLAATYGRGVFTTNAETMGTQEIKGTLSSFIVYPQPSKGTLHVKFDEVEQVDVNIYNMEGRLVFQQKGISSEEPFTVNLSTGMYVLEASSGNSFKKTAKVIMK